MPADPARAKQLALAQKLFVRAGCPTSPTDKEATAAHRKFMKIAFENGFKIDEVAAGIAAAGSAAKAWTIDDFVMAAATGKQFLADPEVQKTISAGRDVFSGIAKGIAAIRARRAK